MNITKKTTLEEVAAAAKEFQRVLNSCEVELSVDVRALNYSTVETSCTKFDIKVRQHGLVYP